MGVHATMLMWRSENRGVVLSSLGPPGSNSGQEVWRQVLLPALKHGFKGLSNVLEIQNVFSYALDRRLEHSFKREPIKNRQPWRQAS